MANFAYYECEKELKVEDTKFVDNRTIIMKRCNKPQQEIYRPGSGPLRKSNLGIDEQDTELINNKIRDDHKYNNRNDVQMRKSKKPEQTFYVPRGLAQSREENTEQRTQINGNYEARSKRYSNRRKGNDNDSGEEWRQYRQGSEPRSLIQSRDRMRDTRSVEPRNQDKYSKPPMGRRNSTICTETDKRIDKLPPRLRKKFLEDNKLNNQINDDWDGASLTFQANNYNYPSNNIYHTLPQRGARGRGRFVPDNMGYRARTPPRSRPQTPPPPPASELEDTKKIEGLVKNNAASTAVLLDWSEEVELNDKLEAEALSDALTRSSSVTSLVDSNVKLNSGTASGKKSKRRRNKRRSGSSARDFSSENSRRNYNNDNTFKVPHEPQPTHNRQRNRRHSRDSSFDRHRQRNPSRDCSFDRNRHSSTSEHENWREEIIRIRQNSESDRSRRNSEKENTKKVERDSLNTKKAGVIVLPNSNTSSSTKLDQFQYPKYPTETKRHNSQGAQQKSLYDPNNPNKPIIVKSPSTRVSVPGFSDNTESPQQPPQMYTTDQYGNIRPGWYDEMNEGFKLCHYPDLIRDIKRADNDLQLIIDSGLILVNWDLVEQLRTFLKDSLQYLLCKDLKFCQSENVEQYLWKILYHNIIEITRKAITIDQTNKEQYKGFLLYLIDEGTKYFEDLLELLQDTYKFKLNNYLGNNHNQKTGLGYVGLALISAQKLFLFLGDLGRYREQVNDTSNYGKCRQWYIKAHEINPKNGRPYNQLAVLAVYARRKLDAVYYYMRSLMSSNPVPSARECLISLFDENRKKYEQGERKRREEKLEKARQHMKQKESEENLNVTNSLRHETWIRPNGGKRVHRTTQTIQENNDSEEEDLASLSSVEVNKRFVISYLHVHGKLITRIGMESFQEAAIQMLKEFRALLQHSPVPLPCNRFLQLLALNMFAIESTQLKDPELQYQSGYRSELQERALVVSLQMFNLILEKCVSLLEEYLNNENVQFNTLPQDIHVLLPAVKIWCDWMLCHSSVWNPPPSTQDFNIGGIIGDAWTRLAVLMNLLENLDENFTQLTTTTTTSSSSSSSVSGSLLINNHEDGYDPVHLPEDGVLSGFTPLMVNEPTPSYARKDFDMEIAQFSLRLNKLLFFGTVFLCGLEPPVLKLEIEDDFREYVSVVCTNNSRDSPSTPQTNELLKKNVLLEHFSDDDDTNEQQQQQQDKKLNDIKNAPREIRDLLSRKVELERKHKNQELHMQRVKRILSQSVVSVHIEIRPKHLVPDTNCFIDHLDSITEITASHVYTLMVPIIVLSELEGLSRGDSKSPLPSTRTALDPQHIRKVAQSARLALNFLKSKPQGVKCVTTKGAVLPSTTFTTEDDSNLDNTYKNDDKILMTCLALSKQQQQTNNNNNNNDNSNDNDNEIKKLFSEVVLLTDDRNLRVKALARDVPVRELMDFMNWAGLG